MRKVLLAIVVLVIVAIVGALLWTRSAQNRIVEVVDRAHEETERLWASDFNRPSIFPAPPPEVDVELASDEDSAAEEEEAEQPFVDATDATSYYRQAEVELGEVSIQDRRALEAAVADATDPESERQLTEILDKYTKAISFVEKGLAQAQCTPWDSAARGMRARVPQPEVHRFLHQLFLARSEQAEVAARYNDAIFDALRAAAYAQDLCRYTSFPSRIHFSSLETIAFQRIQNLAAQTPVGSGSLEKLVKGLSTLDEIEPPLSQTIQVHRLTLLAGFGQIALDKRGPGAMNLWSGMFDVTSTHRLTDTIETTQTVFEELQKTADEPASTSLATLSAADDQFMRSSNPMISNLAPSLGKLKAVTAESSRHLRLAILVAGLQVQRLAGGEFPSSLNALKGQVLRRLPVDPMNGESFEFRPSGDVTPPKLSSAAVENGPDSVDIVVEVPPPAPIAEGVAPELLQSGP